MLYTLLIILHVITSILLIATILMQSAKGEGLAGAFGSGGGSDAIFGADTANVLTKATVVLAIVFALTSISIMLVQVHRGRSLVSETPAPIAAVASEADTTTADMADTATTADTVAE